MLGGSLFSVALIGGLVADPQGLAARLLSRGLLAGLGWISYGFHSCHHTLLSTVDNRLVARDGSHLGIIAAELLAMLVTAIPSHHLVERPILRLKKLVAAVPRRAPHRAPGAGARAGRGDDVTAHFPASWGSPRCRSVMLHGMGCPTWVCLSA